MSNEYAIKKYIEFIEKNGYLPYMFNPYNCTEIRDIAPTVTTCCSRFGSSSTVLIVEDTNDNNR